MSTVLRTLSAPSFRHLLRAGRSGLVLPRYIPQNVTAIRWQSAAASIQAQLEPDFVDEESAAPTEALLESIPEAAKEPVKATSVGEFDKPLDPSKKKTKPDHAAIESDQPEFNTLKGRISYDTLKAITVKPMSFTHMSPVQAAVLPLLPQLAEAYNPDLPVPEGGLPPRDLLIKAKTGTGKTLAFLVPAIESRLKAIEANAKRAVKEAGLVSDKHLEGQATRHFTKNHVGALIISPTRELATQIANEALKLTAHHTGFQTHLFVGGNAKRRQMREFMKGRRDIVVATPGRLRDLMENEPDILDGISKAKMLILDEADTLLDMGFREDIQAIAQHLPPAPERQTFLFSATVSRNIQQIARATLDKNHTFINCVSDNAPPVHAHIPQYHTVLPSPGHQIPHILRLLAHDQLTNPGKSKVIVFLPTTKMTQLYSTFLRMLSKTCLPSGLSSRVYEIHSLRAQESRTKTSAQFRADRGGGSILVSSDVSARGVDYPGVTRIIQIGVPASSDQYIHRVGRTGRGLEGSGRADLVLLPWEVGFVTWQLTEIPMKPLTVSELITQVDTLTADYDSHPNSYASSPRGLSSNQLHPYAPVLENMDKEIKNLLASIDEGAIRETLGAALGYYIARSHELRVQRPVVVQGLKDWTVETCGLPQPPYISDAFLHKLGINDGRTGNNYKGKVIKRERPADSGPRMHWQGRGNVANRTRAAYQDGKRADDMSSTFGYESSERKRAWRDNVQDGEGSEGGERFGGERRRYGDRSEDGGERRPYRQRSDDGGERKPYRERSEDGGERKPYRERSEDGGERRPYRERSEDGGEDRYGGKRSNSRFGDREKRFEKREGDRSFGDRRSGYGFKKDSEGGDGESRSRHFESDHKSFR